MNRYEVTVEVEGTVRDVRLADDEDEAENFSKKSIENAIAEGLKEELSGGESSFDVEVEAVRDVSHE